MCKSFLQKTHTCKSCRSRQELSNEYLLFTCKNRLRCSRERASQSLPKNSQQLEKSLKKHRQKYAGPTIRFVSAVTGEGSSRSAFSYYASPPIAASAAGQYPRRTAKYRDPWTGGGFDTVEEFQKIRASFLEKDTERSAALLGIK